MKTEILKASRNAFVLASAGLLGMLLIMLSFDDGVAGVASIAGVPIGNASAGTIRILAGLDLIVPLGYGAGFIMLAVGLARDEQSRLLALAMVLLTVVGMSLDLLENGILLTDPQSVNGGVFVTIAKFGTLGSMGFMIPLLLTPSTGHSALAKPLLQFVTPIVLATTVMQLSGAMGPWLLIPGLIFIFMFGAWLAHCESKLAA